MNREFPNQSGEAFSSTSCCAPAAARELHNNVEYHGCRNPRIEPDLDMVALIAPVGYEYREYKNWRGIPKPRRCPFCKQAKGEISEANRMYQGVCPNCGTTVPKCLVTLRNLETPMRTHQYCDMRCDSCH